jgi:O-methyltransferase
MDYPIRTRLCIGHLRSVIDIPGDVMELGVGVGTTTFALATELKGSNKKLYACDTFEGLPIEEKPELYAADLLKHVLKKGECKGSLSVFKKMIAGFQVEDIVIPVVGLFDKTLQDLAQKKICFAWLDADLYSSTLVGYKFLEDRIMPRGILGFHDYKFVRCPGVAKVINEALDQNKFKQIDCQNGCIFFKRKE